MTSQEPAVSPQATTDSGPSPRKALGWLFFLLLLGSAAPFIPVPNATAAHIGVIAITIAYVTGVVQLIVQFARLRMSWPKVMLLLAVAVAIWSIPHAERFLPSYLAYTLHDIAMVCAAALAGSLLARLVSEPNMLAPICVLIALIDIWGVLFGGIVAQLMDKAPHLSQKAMSAVPTIGRATGSKFALDLPGTNIGAGDYLFIGLLFTALVANNMNWRGAVKWVTPLVILALLSVAFTPAIALPGLLFIGLGVAIPNLSSFRFTRDECFAMLWAGVFVLFLTGALYFAAPYIVNGASSLERAGNS